MKMDLAMCDKTPVHVERFRSKIEHILKPVNIVKKTKKIGKSKLMRVSTIVRNLDLAFANSTETESRLTRTFARNFDTTSD